MPVTSAAALGTGSFDAQRRTIRFGPGTNQQKLRMCWDAEVGQWDGPASLEFEMVDGWIMDLTGPAPGVWFYAYHPLGEPGQRGQSSYGWAASRIPSADAAFDAGLILQENISAVWWLWDPSSDRELGTVLVPLDPGDLVSNVTVDPVNQLGITLDALPGVRQWQTTGWVDSATQSCDKGDLAPHLYARYNAVQGAEAFLERFMIEWRWVARP